MWIFTLEIWRRSFVIYGILQWFYPNNDEKWVQIPAIAIKQTFAFMELLAKFRDKKPEKG